MGEASLRRIRSRADSLPSQAICDELHPGGDQQHQLEVKGLYPQDSGPSEIGPQPLPRHKV
jgi:hypothetical protein